MQNNLFHDKVAIVTGGASGIGRGLCEELARRGSIVVVADINAAGAEEVRATITHDAAERSRPVNLERCRTE